MTKLKLLTIAVLGLLALNLGMLAFLFLKPANHPMPDRPPHRGEGPKAIIIEKLHFNPEQVQQYEKLIRDHQAAIRNLDEQIRQTKNDLYATLGANSGTGPEPLLEKLAALQKQIELVHYGHFQAIRQICTPDQIKYYQELTRELATYFGAPHPPAGPRP